VGIAASVTKSRAKPSVPFESPTATWTLGSTDAHAPQKSPSATKAARVGPLRGPTRSDTERFVPRIPGGFGLPERPPGIPPAKTRIEVGDDAAPLGPRRLDLFARAAPVGDSLLEH